MRRLIFLVGITLLSFSSFVKGENLDSLWAVWNNKKEADTNRINAMIKIIESNYAISKNDSMYYNAGLVYEFAKSYGNKGAMSRALELQGVAIRVQGYWDSAIGYAEEAMAISREIDDNKTTAACLNDIGLILQRQGKYEEALDKHREALPYVEEIGFKYGIANTYNHIGVSYKYLGNYPMAIDNFLKALRFKEEIEDKRGVAACLNNIAVIYQDQGNYEASLETHAKSLNIRKEIGDKNAIAGAYLNMGNVYILQGKYQEGLDKLMEAQALWEETGNKRGLVNACMNVGICYDKLGDYNEAMDNHLKALKMFEELGSQWGIAAAYSNIGGTYHLLNKPIEAKKWYLKSLELSKRIGVKDHIKQSYLGLAKADSALHNYKDAFDNHKMYILYKDSLLNEENTKKSVQLEMQYEFDKKEAAKQAEQEKKDALTAAEIRRKNLQRNASVGGLALMILLAGVFLVQRNRISKEKQRSEELLLNILPADVAEELKQKGYSDARQFDEVTVLFTDFKDFTMMSEKLSPTALVSEINDCFKAFDKIMEKYGIEKIKTIGDAYMAAGGLPVPTKTNAKDVVSAALEIRDWILQHMKDNNGEGFEIRIGVHTGPVVAGIVGIKKFQYDIWGDTVNTASRMESSGEAGKVNISHITCQLVKDQFNCEHRGKVAAKGKGEIDMYFVER